MKEKSRQPDNGKLVLRKANGDHVTNTHVASLHVFIEQREAAVHLLYLLLLLNNKQLLDEVFVISRIIKVEVRVISRSRRLRLITLTETLIILDITKTESNNCFIIH